mgnify:CR=1 FL=1
MKVNIKETMDILDKSRVVEVKHVKPNNPYWGVHKTMSVRNYIKMMEK